MSNLKLKNKVKSKTTGLRKADRECVTKFMDQVVKIFESCKAEKLSKLDHKGASAAQDDADLQFAQRLMNNGDRVVAWTARKYTEPSWSIMKHNDFFPAPKLWIDVTLNNGNHDYPFFFALAPAKNGSLRSCFYVDRE